jgi:iron-sulfur cluster repair protein YtfE (RIC family)
MALFTRKARTEDVSEPVKLLINDHMKVERIFEQIKEAESPNQKQSLVSQLDAELTRHTTIEEHILYPFVEDNVPEGEGLIDEAEHEHEEASKLLEKLSSMDPDAPDFTPTLEALEKAVNHHVKDEEKELFPKLEDSTDSEALARLRTQLENEKLGLTPSPNLPTTAPSRTRVGGGRAKTSTSSGGTDVWVQPHPKDERWQVTREGAKRASRVFDTQGQAEQFARRLAKRERVELVIAGRDGSVRERNSYGNDPARIPG